MQLMECHLAVHMSLTPHLLAETPGLTIERAHRPAPSVGQHAACLQRTQQAALQVLDCAALMCGQYLNVTGTIM